MLGYFYIIVDYSVLCLPHVAHSSDCWLTVTKSSSHTYRQKNVAVTLMKVPIILLWDLHQLHFLLHSGNKGFMK